MGAIFLLAGFIILLASAYFYASQILHFFPYAELLWLLGLIFIMFNSLYILYKKSYTTENWFKKENTIRNQLAFFTFILSMFGFLIFFCIAYSFPVVNREIFLGLPFFTMMYSTIAVMLSIAVGKKFEEPYKKIERNIESLKHLNKSEIENQFFIEEFIYLQKFIENAFEYKEEKDRAKKQIGEITVQVAHDIRSPLAAIDTIIGSSENRVMTESERMMLRTAFRRINNITNDLVARYKGRLHEPETLVFLYVAIKDMVSEKDLEYSKYNIRFEIEIDNKESAFLLTEGTYKEVNRIFSNVINNSVDSMKNGGVVKIKFARDLKNIMINIIDQGKGISNEKLEELLSESRDLNIGKEIGFGLNHAKNYLKKHGGDINILSSEGYGTEVKLSFPIAPKPKWLAEKVGIDFNKPVIIIDDDKSIHDVWVKKFEELSVLKEDFYTIDQARRYLADHKLSHGVILCDHEFVGMNETRLSFFESVKNVGIEKYLVTTYVDNDEIIERCENNNLQYENNQLMLFIKSCIQLGYAPNIRRLINLTPVDFSSEIVGSRYFRNNADYVMHLVNNSEYITWSEFIEFLNNEGFDIKEVDLPSWQECLKRSGKDNALYRMLLTYRRSDADNHILRFGKNIHEYNIDNVVLFCKKENIFMPKIKYDYLRKIFNHLLEVGFLTKKGVMMK